MSDNGHIRIPNDVWEALTKYHLSNREMRCLMYIIRRTLGYNKNKAEISIKSFVNATEISNDNVCKMIKKLITKNIIFVVKKDNRNDSTYRFNMKYTTWKPLSKMTTIVKNDNQGCQKRQSLLIKDNLKDNTTCLNSDELKREREKETEVYLEKNKKSYQKARLLFNHIKKRDNKVKEPNWKEWTTHIERLHRIDGRDFDEIKDVINWCQQDDFWKNNILSTSKLKKQFTQLRLKMNNKPKIASRDIGSQKRLNTKYSKPKIRK